MTPLLEGLLTKAKEAPSPHEVRLTLLDTNLDYINHEVKKKEFHELFRKIEVFSTFEQIGHKCREIPGLFLKSGVWGNLEIFCEPQPLLRKCESRSMKEKHGKGLMRSTFLPQEKKLRQLNSTVITEKWKFSGKLCELVRFH